MMKLNINQFFIHKICYLILILSSTKTSLSMICQLVLILSSTKTGLFMICYLVLTLSSTKTGLSMICPVCNQNLQLDIILYNQIIMDRS